MKKILLFALSLSIGSLSYAQTTNISVDSFLEPSGTVYIDGDGDGDPETTIQVEITNNTNTGYPAGTHQANFKFKIDGVEMSVLDDPDGKGWVRPIALDFNTGATVDLTITQKWIAVESIGSHELCMQLFLLLDPQFTPLTNLDPNKEFCASFDFDNPVGVGELDVAEISKITNNGEQMTVYVKNASHQVQIKVLSITGQVVKTVTPSVTGQNFYQNVNISDLTSGVYIVTVETENGISAAQKIFIQ